MKGRGFRLWAALGLVLALAAAGTALASPLAGDWAISGKGGGQGWGWAWGWGRRLTVMVVDSGASARGPEGTTRVLGVGEGWRLDDRPFGDLDFLSRLLGWRLTWAAKNPLVTVDLAGGWGGTLPPPGGSVPPQPPGAGGGELACGLYRLGLSPVRVAFVVSNQGRRPVEVTFTSGQEYDMILRRDGEEMWRASEGRAYIESVQSAVMEPGDARIYTETLPPMPAGDYSVEAYFLGAPPRDRPVARLALKLSEKGGLEQALEALSFTVSVQPGQDGAPDTAVLRVRNPGAEEVRFWLPSSRLYDFAAVSESGKRLWRYSDGRSYLPALQEVRLAPRAVREYKAELPRLGPGRYRVEAYYAVFDRPVATCSWRVR
ncbi:MAG: hypothetical protein K6T75_07405 [Acetobacteraceae bacterium]|nr:hypothetical protein [Acetobacteraceae bacterium]